MKIKETFLVMLLSCIYCVSTAQEMIINHYFGYSFLTYTDYLNKNKINNTFVDRVTFASFNYKLEMGRYGMEVFSINSNQKINDISQTPLTPNNTFLNIKNDNFGITFNYNVFDFKGFSIYPHVGIVSNNFNVEILRSWRRLHGLEPRIAHEEEMKIGGVAGVTINYSIYKGFYVQSGLRYMYFPTAGLNKQNLIWESGVGLRLSHRLKFWEKKR